MNALSREDRVGNLYVSLRDCRLAVPSKSSRSNPMVPASNAAASVAEILGVTCIWQGRPSRVRDTRQQRAEGEGQIYRIIHTSLQNEVLYCTVFVFRVLELYLEL